MTVPCFLPPPLQDVLTRMLPRIRARLWRLREHVTLGGSSQGLGWVHTTRACSLQNLNLSADCLSLVLQGIKQVHDQAYVGPTAPPLYEVGPGGAVMFFAGQNVSCTNIPDAQGEYVALTLSLGSELSERVLRRVPQAESGTMHLVPIGVSEGLLGAIMTFLDLLEADGDPTLPLMQQEQIMYMLWKHGVPLLDGPHNLVRQIRQLVETSPAYGWSTVQLAARLHMSERTLRRQLEKCGTRASELVRLSRLHRGLDMLMRENTRVGDVALRCGYTSASRFAERFREQFGLAPGEVRLGRCVRPASD